MTDREQDKAAAARLWHFATQVYAVAPVARACLAAQDLHGADVSLVLFAAWCASEGAALDARQLHRADAHCAAWRHELVAPLRAVRRRWKTQAPQLGFYEAAKAVELEAERRQLGMLAPLAPAPVRGLLASARRSLLERNLRALCEAWGYDAAILDECLAALAACEVFQSAARNPPD